MAEGGASWSDDEDGDDGDDSSLPHDMFPIITELKEEADRHLKAKQFHKAAETYTIALHWPISQFVDFSMIAEHIFRKRAECNFRLGQYFKAIEDSDRAIERAPSTQRNKLADSLYIKMKAIICIGDLVGALPLAVWCTVLRSKSLRAKATLSDLREKLRDAFKKDNSMVHEVLHSVLGFAELMQIDEETREVALECYTELIELLDFLLLPGVLFKRANLLNNMGRHNEAKEDCEKALWSRPRDQDFLELMHEIVKRLKEKESETVKEKVAVSQHPTPTEEKQKTKLTTKEKIEELTNTSQDHQSSLETKSQERPSREEVKESEVPSEDILHPGDKEEDAEENMCKVPTSAATNVLVTSGDTCTALDENTKLAEPDPSQQAQSSKSTVSKKSKKKKKKRKQKKTEEKQKGETTTDPSVMIQREEASPDTFKDDTALPMADTGLTLDDLSRYSQCTKENKPTNSDPLAADLISSRRIGHSTHDMTPHQQEQLEDVFRQNEFEDGMETTNASHGVKNKCERLQKTSTETQPPSKIQEDVWQRRYQQDIIHCGEKHTGAIQQLLLPTEESATFATKNQPMFVSPGDIGSPPIPTCSPAIKLSSNHKDSVNYQDAVQCRQPKQKETLVGPRVPPGFGGKSTQSSTNSTNFSKTRKTVDGNYDHVNPDKYYPLKARSSIHATKSNVVGKSYLRPVQCNTNPATSAETFQEPSLPVSAASLQREQIRFHSRPSLPYGSGKPFQQNTAIKKNGARTTNSETRAETSQEPSLPDPASLQREQTSFHSRPSLPYGSGKPFQQNTAIKKKETRTTNPETRAETFQKPSLPVPASLHREQIPFHSGLSLPYGSGKPFQQTTGLKMNGARTTNPETSAETFQKPSLPNPASLQREQIPFHSGLSLPYGSGKPFQQTTGLIMNGTRTTNPETSAETFPKQSFPDPAAQQSEQISFHSRPSLPPNGGAKPFQQNTVLKKNGTRASKVAVTDSSSLFALDDFPSLQGRSVQKENDRHSKPSYPVSYKPPAVYESPRQALPMAKSPSGLQNVQTEAPVRKPITQVSSNMPSPTTISGTQPPYSSSQNVKVEPPERKVLTSVGKSISTVKPTSAIFQSMKAEVPAQTSTTPQLSTMLPDPRKLPYGVFVLCDHFLEKNRTRPASIYEKTKACKGCENRSKLKYGVWNGIKKEWQIMRPYPEMVQLKVAFQPCRQFSTNTRCLKEPCSFAHGQQERTMWTMEREGILPTPKESLSGSSEKRSAAVGVSPTTQPVIQLRYRPSPPGVTNGLFGLCKSFYTHERCRFGRGCLFAHSKEELQEWTQEFKRKENERTRQEIENKEEVTSLEMAAEVLKGPEVDLVEFLPGVAICCTPYDLDVKLQDKTSFKWTFTLDYKTDEVGQLRQILLVHRYHNTYRLSEISIGCFQEGRSCRMYSLLCTAKLNEPWYQAPKINQTGRFKVALTVSFESTQYGSFEQWVLFDFGRKPYLIQKLKVDVGSGSLLNEPTSARHDGRSHQWDESSVEIIRFVHGTSNALKEEHLSRTYSLPKQSGDLESTNWTTGNLSRDNYKKIMHQLLFLEELFMKGEILSYMLNKTQLHAQWSIFDEMSGMKCAVDGELFGVLHLQEEDALRPDDAAGRLLYRNVSSVWLQLTDSASNKVYEAPVEKVESECVVLRLSSKLCTDLSLFDTCDVDVDAQFQLNRSPLCQMHAAIDRLSSGQLSLLFPEPRTDHSISEVHIRWQWFLDKRLNDNQKTVIKRIASPEYNAPPLVVFGPFGTGKTFTLNQSVRLLVQVDKSHRVLLCTHSNRAADTHVELLHEYLTRNNGVPAATPLRVYLPMRRLETASEIARNYCLIKDDMFVLPSRDDVVAHRVVITTLSTSQVLLELQLFHGVFTHILVDEAAQALEPEMLTPMILAGPNTKVVFTGDHMQMSPEVYSPQARSWGLHKSLAERLFDHYDKTSDRANKEPNVLFLTENYRCHRDILQFPSDNFYGEKLLARGHANQPAHPKLGPLLFYSARGKETKEDNSYINLSEVYEVVKRVKELVSCWPAVWGPRNLSEIAVLAAYRYQVQAIRNNLRKDRDLKDVKVDTIHNVQGEEFRALFISTVRTFHTCKPQQDASGSEKQLYWEFLSDPKLLNTAVTRARCLVAVVGDPVSLCTLGECRSLWRDYIKRCDGKGGLHGTKIQELEKEINASIASIELNPDAEAFVPRKLPAQRTALVAEVAQESSPESIPCQGEQRLGPAETELQSFEHPANESACPQDTTNSQSSSALAEDVREDSSRSVTDSQIHWQEEQIEEGIEDNNIFQDDLIEDETVFPRYMDEIIQALVLRCEETLEMDAAGTRMFQDDDFPTLQAVASKQTKEAPSNAHAPPVALKGRADLKDLFPEVRIVNGRVEVRLTNLGFFKTPSERAQRLMVSSKHQEFLDPSVLRRLVQEEPEKYIVCNLRLSPPQVAYAEIEDTKTPDIQIKGKIRQAFDRDRVVVELSEKKIQSKADSTTLQAQGKVVGVLEHIISPHERQYVCTTDYENPAVMIPINKSATKLVNLTDKSCKDIPIYRKEQNDKATRVKMMKREKFLSGKYLFVVKYLQWRRDFSYPLGIVVRALPRGEDLRSSMEIVYAEHGIRRVFKEETSKYVKEKFPPNWTIPKEEYSNRTTIRSAFTIDPPMSMDLDDALTVEKTSPSGCLIGVHIADVSFFVKPGTPLDAEACLRCTSYYPGQQCENVPMLPRELSEDHCSLLPNQDRLAVSVFVPLDNEGEITGKAEIKRTIVRSCCRLDYSEAQMVISDRNVTTESVPQDIKESIKTLSSLAQKRRKLRMGDSAFDHWQNEDYGEDFEAHELVEEMMILANHEMARFLSETIPELAPLRVQLPPKDRRMAEWIETHGKYVKFSNQFSRIFNDEESDKMAWKPTKMFKIQKSVWSGICQAVESRDLPKLRNLICNENNHPQIAAALAQFRRIQPESRYVCEGDQPQENVLHFSLGMRSYTHFTSPIRRYIDVLVHRLVLNLTSPAFVREAFPKEEITKACRRSTFSQDNARRFGKACKRIHLAARLQQRSRETPSFIESIDKQSISLHISNKEDDVLAGRQKRLLISHLNPVALDEEVNEEHQEHCIVLKWKVRMYKAPDVPSVTEENNAEPFVVSVDGDDTGGVADIPSSIWLRVLQAVKSDDHNKLMSLLQETEAELGILSATNRSKKPDRVLTSTTTENTPGAVYKHPHHDDPTVPASSEMEGHFYEKSLCLKTFDFFNVQLSSHMTNGILLPDIQLFKVNPRFNICIEHRKYPRESFAVTARHQASRERYKTIDDYIAAWKPVLAMEAATEAVKEDDGFIIKGLSLKWEQTDKNASAVLTLPLAYCTSCQLNFHHGDFACVRVPNSESKNADIPVHEITKKPKISVQGNGMAENTEYDTPGQLSTDSSYRGTGRSGCDFWVAHCIVKDVVPVKEMRAIQVTIDLHQTSSNVPQELFDGNGHKCTFQLIHRTLPQRRMYAALCNRLRDASNLVHAICKGEDTYQEHFGNGPTVKCSVVLHHPSCGFKCLDPYQEAAVKEALTKPFTLIQGPPGTGKTMTGVHIAFWFAKRNRELKPPIAEVNKEPEEKEGAKPVEAPAQVIYCGPSNKSVDVVAEYLLRIPGLKILRVYSDQIEQADFPVPNKLKPGRRTRSEDLKIVSEPIRSVSLHHVIRRPDCPYSRDLKQIEEKFPEDKKRGERTSEQEVSEYCKLIGQAERWALQESGVQIILCTCVVAGSPRIATSCDNIQQCIVDECGMCLEPETLVPITFSGARQVILIGDHKQLQPIIQDNVAKTLGLNVSMFERHSKRAIMLELQYRMHSGICEFPSKQFYEEKLKTADVVKTRDPGPVSFWPAQVRRQINLPIAFCHVEGQEEAATIATAESNEDSKRNMKEARKAVQVAKCIVNRYRSRVRMSDVVILSPYREQCSKITELLKGAYEDIKVTTATKSQGSEWDYVIISLVRSLKKDELDPEPSLQWLRKHLGFVTDEHQMNVGLTRARKGLCIIGNKHLLSLNPMWQSLLKHYEENHCLVDESWPWP